MVIDEVNKSEFRVSGACNGKALKHALSRTLAEEEAQAAADRAADENRRKYIKRRIGHPLFKNGTLEQVTQVLAAAPIGEVIFRPSSKGPANLTATIKLTASGALLHVDIAEEDKPSAAELGQSLYIGRDEARGDTGERYDDLDEVSARYVEPLCENVREIVGHRKYLDEADLPTVERTLQEEKRSQPATIPYRLSPTKKYADYFILAYLPKAKTIKEYLKVTPGGFVYRRQTFPSVEKMLQWFKVHWKEPPPRGRRRAHRAAPWAAAVRWARRRRRRRRGRRAWAAAGAAVTAWAAATAWGAAWARPWAAAMAAAV